ncbi:MAG: phenylalanine--tRNA ligase beta subunit-related protein [Bacteroidia bacterium]|nr:phenylalanine--tRNA ligase beta subunit-related protein [Bacteroidia bacterium]
MRNIEITISDEILAACSSFRFIAIECEVKNSPHNNELWQEIDAFCTHFAANNMLEDINKRPTIFATRQTYKKLGKDPNRYRPSAEALCRRVVRGLGLYRIDTLVDVINLVSLKTGYSIGGFDIDKIQGNLVLGVGKADEKFEAIGRGFLNIEGLPVYRDEIGGIGTPTSDEERTKITAETTRLLMIINGYSGEEGLQEATNFSIDLLKKYAGAKEIKL